MVSTLLTPFTSYVILNDMNITERLASDPTYARLHAEYVRLTSEADAASDGALHHAYPADIADRMAYAIERKYDNARAAFLTYQAGVAR